MRKLTTLLLTSIILLSSCTADEAPRTDLEPEPEITITTVQTTTTPVTTTTSVITTTPVTTTPIITTTSEPQLSREERDRIRYEQLANDIAEAFINKDTEFVSKQFGDRSGNAFNFIKELNFTQFEITEQYRGDASYIFYFNIIVEDGTDDVFTLGGNEWELHLTDTIYLSVHRFTPKGILTERIWYMNWDSNYAIICYLFSKNLNVFETMNDFNLLAEQFEYRDFHSSNGSYIFLLSYFLNSAQYYLENEEKVWKLSPDEIVEQAEYMLGITNVDPSEFMPHGAHGWFWLYPEIVSEIINDTGMEIVLNFYGDTIYMSVAKTMKYNLEFGDRGVRIVSVELLYSNDDLVLALNGI
jgi:hypothetical protein